MNNNNRTINSLIDSAQQLGARFMENISQTSTYIEVGLIIVIVAISYLIGKAILRKAFKENPEQKKLTLWRRYVKLLPYLAIVIGLWSLYVGYQTLEFDVLILRPIAVIATSWLFIQAITMPLKPGSITNFIRYSGWLVMLLWLFNLIDSTISVLENLSVEMGDFSISLLDLLKAIIIILVLFWLASTLSRYFNEVIRRSTKFTPSIKVLFGKVVRMLFYAAAVILSANALGLDLTALAIFGGALGVGIGLGLQQIVANFISGIILLLDKSIKPGDVITVGETYGWVEKLNTRYASVTTRSGTEILIPNENLITQEVINWTHSNKRIRLQVSIGVSYNCDMRQVQKLCVEATSGCKRVLANPTPICLMVEYGDSSVNFYVRFWISDPQNGTTNVKSDVMYAIWDSFKQANIEIPFPQRVLHIEKSDSTQQLED